MPVKLTAKTIASTNVRRFTLEFSNVDYGTVLALLDPFEKAEVESCLQPESIVHEKLIALEIMARRLYEKELVRPPARSGWHEHNRNAERVQRANRLRGMLAGDITRPTHNESVQQQDRVIAEMAAGRVETVQEELGREAITLMASEADFLGELYAQFQRCAFNGDQSGAVRAARDADTTIARIRSDRSARDSVRFRRSEWISDAPSLEQQVGGDSPPAPSEPVVSVAVSVPPPVVDPRPGIRAAIEAQAEYDADEDLARQEAETRSRLWGAERRSAPHSRAEAYLNSRGQSLQTVSEGVRRLILDRARRGTLPPHPREST